MVRKDIIDAIYSKINEEYILENDYKSIKITKGRINLVIDALLEVIEETLADTDEIIRLRGLGTFSKRFIKGSEGFVQPKKDGELRPWKSRDMYIPKFKYCHKITERVKAKEVKNKIKENPKKEGNELND